MASIESPGDDHEFMSDDSGEEVIRAVEPHYKKRCARTEKIHAQGQDLPPRDDAKLNAAQAILTNLVRFGISQDSPGGERQGDRVRRLGGKRAERDLMKAVEARARGRATRGLPRRRKCC